MRGLKISKEMHEWATNIEKVHGVDRSALAVLGLVVSKINNFDHEKKIEGTIFKTEILSAGLNNQTQFEIDFVAKNILPGLGKAEISSLMDQGLRHIKDDIELDESIDIFERLVNFIKNIKE